MYIILRTSFINIRVCIVIQNTSPCKKTRTTHIFGGNFISSASMSTLLLTRGQLGTDPISSVIFCLHQIYRTGILLTTSPNKNSCHHDIIMQESLQSFYDHTRITLMTMSSSKNYSHHDVIIQELLSSLLHQARIALTMMSSSNNYSLHYVIKQKLLSPLCHQARITLMAMSSSKNYPHHDVIMEKLLSP